MAKIVVAVTIMLILLTSVGVFYNTRQANRGQPTPTLAVPTSTMSTQEQQIVQASKEILSQKLTVALDSIEVITIEAINWPDASLGAPEEGQLYAQVITPGYKLKILAISVEYEIHADAQGSQVVILKDGKRI